MKSAALLIFLISCCHLCSTAQEKPVRVANAAALQAAVAKAIPGSVIVMLNGDWKDVRIHLSTSGSSAAPVVLRAQDRGKVRITGKSELVFQGKYIVADGLYFTEGSAAGDAVVRFNGDSCRLTQSAIVGFNTPQGGVPYHWIYFKGSGNHVDHCFFKGKNNNWPLVANAPEGARYNYVMLCHFKDIPAGSGQREIVRVEGASGRAKHEGANFRLEQCFFENAHGDGRELVSLRSGRNLVQNNTFLSCKGGIAVHNGHHNTVAGNYILGRKTQGAAGIRISGTANEVVNNYISEISTDGIVLLSGVRNDSMPATKDYLQVRDALIAHNTIADGTGAGIRIGVVYGNAAGQLLPEGNRIVNNLVYRTENGGILTEGRSSLPADSLPNKLEGNISYGTTVNDPGKGIRQSDPGLKMKEGIYGIQVMSAAVDRGALVDVKTDIHGQARIDRLDVGADESSTGKILRQPLTENNTGPTWVMRARAAGAKEF